METLLNSALASGGRGVGTIVRFYVKPEKFESLISDTDLLDMTFYTTFTTQTKKEKLEKLSLEKLIKIEPFKRDKN